MIFNKKAHLGSLFCNLSDPAGITDISLAS